MENIERTQFVVLTGHLDDQSLPDLIRMLRVQRKSGRLQVEYPEAPGSFFFEEGQMIDAQFGSLRGLEALHAAISLHGGASFNFNPLVRPPERSIDRQEQKFITDLIEVPQRENLAEIKIAGNGSAAAPMPLPPSPRHAPLQLAPAELVAPLEERLTAVEEAIISSSRRFSRERLLYAIIISFLIGLTLVTALQALFGSFPANAPAPAKGGAATAQMSLEKKQEGAGLVEIERGATSQAAASTKKAEAATKQATQQSQPAKLTPVAQDAAAKTGGEYIINVLMEVKDGRVTKARILNARPGASAVESRALKMARERRYPDNFTGSERLQIRVKP